MIISVHQPQYIPWLGYIDKIEKSDSFVFLDNVQYKAREFQNRNKICTKDGWIWLTVPVAVKGLREQKICDVKIDNDIDWKKKHLRSIEIGYNKAKFFDRYYPFFEKVYSSEWSSLSKLNIFIIDYILKELKITTKMYYETEIGTESQKTDRIIELCKKLKADIYLSGRGGKEYMDESKFKDNNIELKYQDFEHPIYSQVYAEENKFLPYMSIIDLLFNEGENSIGIIKENNR